MIRVPCLTRVGHEHILGRKDESFTYLHTRGPRNILCHLACSSVEVVLSRYHPLSHLWKSPEMTMSEFHSGLVWWTLAYTKNHCKTLHATHIGWFEVALRMESMKRGAKTYDGCLPRQRATYPASVQWEYNSPGRRRRSEDRSPRQSRFARERQMSRSISLHIHPLAST